MAKGSKQAQIAPNINGGVEGTTLNLSIDLSEVVRLSESGKSDIVAATTGPRGQQKVMLNGIEHKLTVLLYRPTENANASGVVSL